MSPVSRSPKPEVLITEGINAHSAEIFTQQLQPYFPVDRIQVYSRKAFDPELKQYVQLLANLPYWAPLAAVAGVFFAKIANLSAVDAYAWIKDKIANDPQNPVAKISKAVADVNGFGDGKNFVVLGLSLPDSRWGTAFEFSGSDQIKLALEMVYFGANLEKIEAKIMEAVANGHAPLGRAQITLLDDGTLLVHWRSQKTFERKTIHLKPSNDNGSV